MMDLLKPKTFFYSASWCAIFALFFSTPTLASPSSAQSGVARVESTQGFVYKKPATEGASYDMIGPGGIVHVGDMLRTTKRALVLIQSPGGHRLKSAPETEIRINQLPSTGHPQLNVHLFEGHLYTLSIGDPARDDDFVGIIIEVGPHKISAKDGKIFLAAAGERGSQEAIMISHTATGEIKNKGGDIQRFQKGQGFVITSDQIAPLGKSYHEKFTQKLNWTFQGNLSVEDHDIEI